MGVIVITMHSGIFQCTVHALHLSVGPGMVGLGKTMFDAMCGTDAVKEMLKRILLVRLVSELNAIVGQDGVNLVRHGGNQTPQELGSCHVRHLWMQFSKGKLRSTVYGHEEIEFALFGSDLSD